MRDHDADEVEVAAHAGFDAEQRVVDRAERRAGDEQDRQPKPAREIRHRRLLVEGHEESAGALDQHCPMPRLQGRECLVDRFEGERSTFRARRRLGCGGHRELQWTDQGKRIRYARRLAKCDCVFGSRRGDAGFDGLHDADVDARSAQAARERAADDGLADAGIRS